MKKNSFFAAFKNKNASGGFTLIETMVSVGIFVLMMGAAYQVMTVMYKGTQQNREGVSVSALADQYLEIARNLPYSSVGTLTGSPHGLLPDAPNTVTTTYNGGTYRIYYEVTYVDDPADGKITLSTDAAPNDYKQVKLSITNSLTNKTYYFITNIVPKGLEGLASGGALSLQVIDASGNPVSGATIAITSVGLTPAISLSRLSDSAGKWIEVGLPNGTNAYHIVVSKSGYSTDATYPIVSGTNPSPTKPDATISNGLVTSISFAIDLTSNLTVNTLDTACAAIGSVGIGVRGAKLIGTPAVYKFNNTYTTGGGGSSSLSNIEWDTYIPALTGSTYMIYGSSPIQQINLLPNTTQGFTLILGAATTNSLLTIVKDSSTGDPIEGASVTLANASPAYSSTKYTGGSLWSQNDWTGGTGQASWSNVTKYFADDGHISTTDLPIAIRLLNSGGKAIVTSGNLTSSTFDTGTSASAYTTLTWQPTSQSGGATVKFQVASNNDNATWNYIGPDGTSGTYYTTSGTTISTANNGNRYVRIKVYEATTNVNNIPVVTSLSLNYVSGCFTPGQVMFPSISTGNNYTLTISMAGYTTKVVNPLKIVSGYNVQTISLSH